MHIKQLVVLLLLSLASATHAQEISFKDTIAAYNSHRIQVNKAGMQVLGGWGLLNVAAGGVCALTAQNDEWKYFNEMNVLWGAVNAGIAAFGLAGVRKELNTRLTSGQAYQRYVSNKRTYLINIGLDVVYIGGGVALNEYARGKSVSDHDLYAGFGKSVAIQGIFLLLFDNMMFAAHQRYNSRWFTIMNELRFTGNSIGFSHTF